MFPPMAFELRFKIKSIAIWTINISKLKKILKKNINEKILSKLFEEGFVVFYYTEDVS